MPANFDLTWDGDNARWRVMYRGKRYVRSCRQLGAPPTKEKSYQAANQWWRSKLAEIDGQREAHPQAVILDELQRRVNRAKANGRRDEALEWAAKHGALEAIHEAAEVEIIPASFLVSEAAKQRREVVNLLGRHDSDPLVAEALYGDDEADEVESIPKEDSIQSYASRYIGNFAIRHRSNGLSAHEADAVRRHVQNFATWIGPGNPLSVITAARWEAYWRHLSSRIEAGEVGSATAKKDWSHGRRFIRWACRMTDMKPLGNLDDRSYKFGGTTKGIDTFTNEEVTTLVEKAPGQLKLHVLLMLNCGFTQVDIGTLTHAEVNYAKGTITRQRVKTRTQHGNTVPIVTYALWPQTHALLVKYRSDDPKLALTTLRGLPWWVERLGPDGKIKRTDNIEANYRHVREREGLKLPLKYLRKTSASKLDDHGEYGRYAQHFLGQAPDSVAGKHYVKPSQDRFDEALAWLGWAFGIVQDN